ncbi:hypothetical protein M3212_19070 [Alkalihalobacillus oceani]|uniref:YhzD family protein n=1 Tax=Halalkalibacter oceani TaxID=1653776 RepID=UPI00203CDE3D|nr:YhzD family protein [Halalkalibacter oceani]MCM3762849.1 hypothetical protein [Halalkalibacter oceani]
MEYTLTVFHATGELAFEDRIKAETDEAAKALAEEKLRERQYHNQTHRLTRSGTLLLFHR